MTQEREKVKLKIVKLLNVTISNGAAEAEAMAAAEHAAKLMEHYDIQASELQIRNSTAVQVRMRCPRYINKRVGQGCFRNLARLVDCMYWTNSGTDDWTLFGLPQDTELGEYLYDVISRAVLAETLAFGRTEKYKVLREEGYSANGLRVDFLMGMEDKIASRLYELWRDRRQNQEKEVTGRSLVLVKDEVIKDEFKKTGIRLVSTEGPQIRGNVSGAAIAAGERAGLKVQLGSAMSGKVSGGLLG